MHPGDTRAERGLIPENGWYREEGCLLGFDSYKRGSPVGGAGTVGWLNGLFAGAGVGVGVGVGVGGRRGAQHGIPLGMEVGVNQPTRILVNETEPHQTSLHRRISSHR